MVSKEAVICPYFGLINVSGNEQTVWCIDCGKEFTCVKIVEVKFKTIKSHCVK
jgi:hypothetical protein